MTRNRTEKALTKMDHTAENIAIDLIGLLHQNAPVEEFSARLSQLEALQKDEREQAAITELTRMAIDVKNRLDMHQVSEQGMLAMVDSAKELSSRLDLASLLQAIVSRARNLLGSHIAWLTVYDAEKDEFRVIVSEGAISIQTTRMSVTGRLGIAGVVMSTKLPFYTPNYLLDNRFSHDPGLDNTLRNEGIAALVGVPLLFDGKVIGLLFVADRYLRAHTALNIAILSTLATHAAVAINNAKAFEQVHAALQNADRARAELERHAREIQSAAEAHEQLTALLAKGASLAMISQTVAQLLGGSVLILDEAFHVISHATAAGYDGAAADAYMSNNASSALITQAVRNSRSGGRSIVASEKDGESCRVVAVIGGNDVIGAVLLFQKETLSEISIRTFERIASVIGIVLLSQERVEASKSRDISTLLRLLISSHADERESIACRAERLGLDLSQPVSLVLIEIEHPKAEFVSRYLRSEPSFSGLVLDEVYGALAIICSTTRAQDVLKDFSVIAKREFSGVYRGILSKPIQSPHEIPALYTALRRGLSVLRRIGVSRQIIDQNQMALYSVLFETHDQASLQSFLDSSIGRLVAHDEKRGTQLAETLLIYLDNSQNARTTASRLGIHFNTVRQRLASIEELIGYWGSPNRTLEIHVALKLWNLTEHDA